MGRNWNPSHPNPDLSPSLTKTRPTQVSPLHLLLVSRLWFSVLFVSQLLSNLRAADSNHIRWESHTVGIFFPGLSHDTVRFIRYLFKSERTLKQNLTTQKNKRVAIWLLGHVPSKSSQNYVSNTRKLVNDTVGKNWTNYKGQAHFLWKMQ